jgi:hypothetical protein
MTNLTLDERLAFEKLTTEYANASMDCVRAHQRRHDALHRIEDWINARTASIAEAVRAHAENIAPLDREQLLSTHVPTGTHCTLTAGCIHYAGHSGHCYTGDAPPPLPIEDTSGGN